jgi:tetratricopeptide (TPR) repeat protein
MFRSTKILWIILVLLVGAAAALSEARAASPLAGKLVYLEGQVAVRRGDAAEWLPAQANQELFQGDAVKTGAASRAAILCLDESQIKLNENTLLILKSVAPSPRLRPGQPLPAAAAPPPSSLYRLIEGEIWLRNKNEKFHFELETPAVTATIRGTEFNIRVKKDGATSVTLLEGNVCLANTLGQVCLQPGEEGLTLPGQAPSKQVLLQPADAVQWSLYYPGIISYRDLPLASAAGEARAPAPPALTPRILKGEQAYDQGRLGKAKEEAQAILGQDRENGRALTLMGWISLQYNTPEEAEGYFRRVRLLDEMAVIGLALSRYRLGDPAGADAIMQAARARLRPTPLLATMSGYFAMLAGKAERAKSTLETVREGPAASLARSLLAQIYLVQNRKDAALAEASQALSRSPASPMALLTMGLVKIANFDLPQATGYLEKALAADPRFVDAHVYLAKIWLGSDYLARAQKTIDAALSLAPREGVVLSLAGFVRLAYRDYSGARQFLDRAAKASPSLGEPHLGLAICHFRYKEFTPGLAEMLTATLLDPRAALYQTELGKALYQVRSFGRALEVYDYAKTLDPKDPTPYLYKGIALADLNRPGEAVQEINRSIELNDNRGVFRSKILLDRDMAVRNYNLARSYQQLGLGEWAYSKAVTATKSDPMNSSAHLFLENAYIAQGQRVTAADAESLIYRVLAPANQNTFSSLGETSLGLTLDYTPMFEMPYWRAVAQGGVGGWQESKLIQDHLLAAYGGMPGVAFFGKANFVDDQGFRRRNGDFKLFDSAAALKWEPTVNGTFLGFFEYFNIGEGDLSNPNNFSYSNEPGFRRDARFRQYETAYVHRFNPQATTVVYFTYQNLFRHDSLFAHDTFFGIPNTKLAAAAKGDWEYSNFQAQQHLVLGKHTLIGGLDYFSGHLRFSEQDLLTQFGAPIFSQNLNFRPPEWTYSFYLLDYWRLAPGLLVELGLFKDFSKNARHGFAEPIYTSLWNPRFGANYQLNPNHTFRAVAQRSLNTHLDLQPLLVPTEVAGFPWLIDTIHGAVIREAGASWEAQWNTKTFTVLRVDLHKLDTPDLSFTPLGLPERIREGWKRYQATLAVNRILTPSLGLSAGVVAKRVVPDLVFQPDIRDFSEIDPFIGLSYLHRSGWLAGIKTFLVTQQLKDRNDNLFGLVNLRVGREFPNKRGLTTLEVENLFNRHFFTALEPLRDPDFLPARRIMFKLAFYF